MPSQVITFKEFLSEQFLTEAVVDLEAGIFVKVLPTTESIALLKDTLDWKPISMVEDLHCTAIYSKTVAKNVNLPYVSKDKRFSAKGVKLEYWEGHDKEGYVVLKLKSDDLQKLHKRFRKQGIEPTFKDYSPHVSIMHPVPNPDSLKTVISELNYQLFVDPLKLEFYYGGYTIMDKEV